MKENVIEKIIPTDYSDEMKKSYLDYAMSVIVTRALPDVRDGLKPVHRRIIYAMKELGLMPVYNEKKKSFEYKPHKKCARIVGDTMGKYHPHGDASIYSALVLMSQDFKMMRKLVIGEGNFGSIDGDSPAHMRYTEASLHEMVYYLINDMDKDTVDFVDNFDGTLQQPTVLPAKYPNLLVNGVDGVAVGMTSKIPPHNLSEVIDGAIALIDNPKLTVKDLMKYIKGPDFPTGAEIINEAELIKMYETGEGRIKIRSKITTEIEKGGKVNLIITEVPYTYSGNITRLIEDIADMAKEGKMPELYDLKNQSSRDGVRIVLELKKGIDVENFKLKLYKKTGIESNFSTVMRAIVKGQPRVLNLKQLLEEFVMFQDEIYTRKYNYLLKKASKRLEVLEGLLKAVDVIDVIIEVIRGSKSRNAIKLCMSTGDVSEVTIKTKSFVKIAKSFNFTEPQIEAILNIQLIGLMGLEITKITDERDELRKSVLLYEKLLGSKKALFSVIKKELEELKATQGTPRKTKISQLKEESYKEVVSIEELYFLLDKFNYVKIVDTSVYSKLSADALSEYKLSFKVNSDERIFVVGDAGNSYMLKPLDIGKSKISDRGNPITNLIESQEEIMLCCNFEAESEKGLIFVTQLGESKIVPFSEYDTSRKKILAIALETNDKVVFASPVNNEKMIAFISNSKKVSKMNLSEIIVKKRSNRGSITINLSEGDILVACSLLSEKPHIVSYKGKDYSLDGINAKKRKSALVKLK